MTPRRGVSWHGGLGDHRGIPVCEGSESLITDGDGTVETALTICETQRHGTRHSSVHAKLAYWSKPACSSRMSRPRRGRPYQFIDDQPSPHLGLVCDIGRMQAPPTASPWYRDDVSLSTVDLLTSIRSHEAPFLSVFTLWLSHGPRLLQVVSGFLATASRTQGRSVSLTRSEHVPSMVQLRKYRVPAVCQGGRSSAGPWPGGIRYRSKYRMPFSYLPTVSHCTACPGAPAGGFGSSAACGVGGFARISALLACVRSLGYGIWLPGA